MTKFSKQTTFDIVARHLLVQGERSTQGSWPGEDFCAYRGDGGLKCAAGVLIPDSEYREAMEGFSAEDIAYLRDRYPMDLVNELQGLHDVNHPGEWQCELRSLAAQHELSPAVIDQWEQEGATQ